MNFSIFATLKNSNLLVVKFSNKDELCAYLIKLGVNNER